MDPFLFRFEFDHSFHIVSICIRAKSFDDAHRILCLIFGDSISQHIVLSFKLN